MLKFVCSLVFIMILTAAQASATLDFDVLAPSDSWYRSDESTIVLNEYLASQPTRIRFHEPDDIKECRIEKRVCERTGDRQADLQLVKSIDAIQPFEVSLNYKRKSSLASQTIKFKFLGAVSPGFHVHGKSVLKKNILLSPLYYLMAISPEGKLLFYKKLSGLVTDFRQHSVSGKVIYSYVKVTDSTPLIGTNGLRVFLNREFKQFRELNRIVDSHEFLHPAENHFIFTEYDAVSNGEKCLVEQRVVEHVDGKENTIFVASDFLRSIGDFSPSGSIPFKGRTCESASHLNSVQIVSKDRWLLSLGNRRIVMWNPKRKKSEWILGGASGQFSNAPPFELIHTPVWIDAESRLVFFDNGVPGKLSVLRDIVLDLSSKSIKSSKILNLDGSFADAGGSLELDESGVISVGLGRRSGGKWDFQEYKDGTLTMGLRLSDKQQYYNYRVYRGEL